MTVVRACIIGGFSFIQDRHIRSSGAKEKLRLSVLAPGDFTSIGSRMDVHPLVLVYGHGHVRRLRYPEKVTVIFGLGRGFERLNARWLELEMLFGWKTWRLLGVKRKDEDGVHFGSGEGSGGVECFRLRFYFDLHAGRGFG